MTVTLNGNGPIIFDSSGNVGIGTSTPSGKLHVESAGTNYIYTRNSAASGTAGVIFQNTTDTRSWIINGTNFDAYDNSASATRMRIDINGYMQGYVNGLGAGRIPAMQFFRLNSNLAGANSTSAQSVFGVGVTLVASTVYAFDYYVEFEKSAGTTSHNMGLGFGGSATINNILYGGPYQSYNTAYSTGSVGSAASFDSNTASNVNFRNGIVSAATVNQLYLKGTVSINAGGTFIPQYTLSAAPGGAYSTLAGSYFSIYPLAASGSNVSIGSWA